MSYPAVWEHGGGFQVEVIESERAERKDKKKQRKTRKSSVKSEAGGRRAGAEVANASVAEPPAAAGDAGNESQRNGNGGELRHIRGRQRDCGDVKCG